MFKENRATYAQSVGEEMKLYKYQEEFIKGAESYYGEHDFLMLADEPGLGKSAQAICLASALRSKRVLIICPASLKIMWEREVLAWSGRFYPQIIKTSAKNLEGNCYILNYDVCKKHRTLCVAWDPDFIILDEAHYLKNPTSMRTKAVLGSVKEEGIVNGRRVLALTGTPIPNRPIELFPLLHACSPAILDHKGYFEYAQRYCSAWQAPWGFDVTGSSNSEELCRIVGKVMIRRVKEDVLGELPPKTYKLVVVEPDKATRAVLKEEKNFSVDSLSKTTHTISIEGLSTVRRLMGEAKIKMALDHIKGLLVDVPKIVIFAHHASVVDGLYEGLLDYGPVKLTGKTGTDRRQKAVDMFQRNESSRVFIGNIQAASVGLTLTAASYIVFVESSWVPSEIEQASNRCHRIGQTNNVTVEFLVVKKSLDEHILTKVLEKREVIDELIVPTELSVSLLIEKLENQVNKLLGEINE